MTATRKIFAKTFVLATMAALALGVQARSAMMPTDQQISHAVEHAINRSPELAGDVIYVWADHGQVTLGGTVDSKFERHIAKKLALKVAGVKSVDSDLSIVNN